MNLLFRLLRFLTITIFNLLMSLIVLIFTLVVLPFLIWVVQILRDLVSISFTATVNGPRQFTEMLASEWTRRILELGAPIDRIDQIFSFCRFTARSLIVLGWLISLLFTVITFRVIYGWLFI